MSLNRRIQTIFKKAYELAILCHIEACVVYYGPDGRLKTWPKERGKVEDLALRYNAATKRKNSITLHEFLDKKKKKHQPKKKRRRIESENVNEINYPTWYPEFDHYSPSQLDDLILSLEHTFYTLQERIRVIDARNSTLQTQQSQNPSPYMYNHGDCTLSKLPLAHYQNQIIQQQLYALDHNNTNTNFQHPCSSSTPQEQNNSFTNTDVQQHPHLSNNTASDHMVGSFSQHISDMFSSCYDGSNFNFMQTSSPPPLPNTYLLC